MRFRKILFITLFLFIIIFLVGCKKEVECRIASDCGSNTACTTNTCTIDGVCVQNVAKNCCGNGICESSVFENSCTCNDCGSCTGKGFVSYNISTTKGSKLVQTKYSVYTCNEDNNCVIDSDPKITVEQKYASSFDLNNYFKINALFTLDQPFNIDNDKLKIRLTLADINNKTVLDGITITGIQVLNQNSLLAEKSLSYKIKNVGDELNEELSLTSVQTDLESDVSLAVNIDYTYTPIANGKIGDLLRSNKKIPVTTQRIVFIKPEVQNFFK